MTVLSNVENVNMDFFGILKKKGLSLFYDIWLFICTFDSKFDVKKLKPVFPL